MKLQIAGGILLVITWFVLIKVFKKIQKKDTRKQNIISKYKVRNSFPLICASVIILAPVILLLNF